MKTGDGWNFRKGFKAKKMQRLIRWVVLDFTIVANSEQEETGSQSHLALLGDKGNPSSTKQYVLRYLLNAE